MSGLPVPYRIEGAKGGAGALVRRPSHYRCQCSGDGCACSVNCSCGCRWGKPCTCAHQYAQDQQRQQQGGNQLQAAQQQWQQQGRRGGCGSCGRR